VGKIIQAIRSIKKSLTKDEPERSFKDGDQLTEWEDNFLKEKALCPDCERGRLSKGPCGGGSQNLRCDYCGSRFNFHGLFTTDRISDACPFKPEIRSPLPGTHRTGVFR